MASSLPDHLVEEILVRLPQDEPVHLARASLVCTSWRRVLVSDRDCFLRRCRGFHGAPPLLGYFDLSYGNDAKRFVPATSTTSPVRMPALHRRRWSAVDCRHGRVLIHYEDEDEDRSKRGFIVWDPLTGRQQHLGMPSASYPSHMCLYTSYTGAVLCAKDDGGCDHLDCQAAAGPFRVVCVETNLLRPIFACATSYSSLTGEWNAPAPKPNHDNHDFLRGHAKHSLLVGDAIYFLFQDDRTILRYDLGRHWLSEMDLPPFMWNAALMTAEDGGLGLAALPNNDNRIHTWSWHDDDGSGGGCWVEQRVIEFETLLPRRMRDKHYRVVGSAEGTSTVFVDISFGTIFVLDVKSKKMSRFRKRNGGLFEYVLPYVRFYAPSEDLAIKGQLPPRAIYAPIYP
ncbi:hypothetical protein Zm00014a_020093 [Zea mays]|uniref:F-box domain-containing protein n=2 Tax=Zea mays TaxID=4577 RepID=A0A3L6F7P9_MAIZE|nr:hypothetical protein Zm00014a_020093 [Zea mays]